MAPVEQEKKPRGRPKKKPETRGAHLRGPNWKPKVPKGPYVPTGKPRGRPKKKTE